MADSLYNLQLVQDFCASRLPRGCPLSLEDLLYVPPPLKVRPSWGLLGQGGHLGPGVPSADPASHLQVNLVVMLAELFMCFEVLKPDFVQVKDLPDGHGEAPGAWGSGRGRVGEPNPHLTLFSVLQLPPPGALRPPHLRTTAAVGTLPTLGESLASWVWGSMSALLSTGTQLGDAVVSPRGEAEEEVGVLRLKYVSPYSSPVFTFRHPLLSSGGPQSPLRGSTGEEGVGGFCHGGPPPTHRLPQWASCCLLVSLPVASPTDPPWASQGDPQNGLPSGPTVPHSDSKWPRYLFLETSGLTRPYNEPSVTRPMTLQRLSPDAG